MWVQMTEIGSKRKKVSIGQMPKINSKTGNSTIFACLLLIKIECISELNHNLFFTQL